MVQTTLLATMIMMQEKYVPGHGLYYITFKVLRVF